MFLVLLLRSIPRELFVLNPTEERVNLVQDTNRSSLSFGECFKQILELVQKELQNRNNTSESSPPTLELHPQDEYHISLSKVFPIRHHHVELLTQHIQNALTLSYMPRYKPTTTCQKKKIKKEKLKYNFFDSADFVLC
jgi:hypothetical protein